MAEIQTIAVIGAGAIGRGIAYASALAGYGTILEDILPGSLRSAATEIRYQMVQAAELGVITKPEADSAFQRVEYASTVEDAARRADLVIESVPEELESKLEIFTLLDRVAKPGTILASNTKTLSISEFASITYRAKKIIGMRFAHPVDEMQQLEIVRAAETDDETVAACAEVGRRMRKDVVVVQDIPWSTADI